MIIGLLPDGVFAVIFQLLIRISRWTQWYVKVITVTVFLWGSPLEGVNFSVLLGASLYGSATESPSSLGARVRNTSFGRADGEELSLAVMEAALVDGKSIPPVSGEMLPRVLRPLMGDPVF